MSVGARQRECLDEFFFRMNVECAALFCCRLCYARSLCVHFHLIGLGYVWDSWFIHSSAQLARLTDGWILLSFDSIPIFLSFFFRFHPTVSCLFFSHRFASCVLIAILPAFIFSECRSTGDVPFAPRSTPQIPIIFFPPSPYSFMAVVSVIYL